jgi:hypothetical protein
MKIWLLLLGIFVIFTILCSPVLAISKSDLITYYQTAPSSLYDNSDNSDSVYQIIKEKSAQITPTTLPTPQLNGTPFPKWPDSTFLKPFSKPSIPSSPLIKPGVTTDYVTCPPFVPVGKMHRLMVYLSCFSEPCDFINPVTGVHYGMAIDDRGTKFLVKEGCQCSWATESDY